MYIEKSIVQCKKLFNYFLFFGNGDLQLSAGGKELCGNVIILENDIEHKAPDGEIAFFLMDAGFSSPSQL